jgi:hypothetical protein
VTPSSPTGPEGRRGAPRPGPVTAALARLALRLYPLGYQGRYGEEMRALLEDQPPRPATVLDLLRGALRAHLRPGDAPAGAVDPADRARATACGVLLCWEVFAMAGFGFYKSTEDHPFSAAGHAHPLLRDAHLAVQAVAVIASVTVVVGAVPLIATALARARRDPTARRTVALPFLPLTVFAAVTGAFIAIAHAQAAHHTSAAGYGGAIVWIVTGVVCGAACVLACRAALFATPVRPDRLRAALASGTLVTIAMLAITLATAVYAIALIIDASSLAAEPNGPFQLLSVTASLIVQVIVMTAATVLALITTRRGWPARRQLAEAR